MSQRVSLSNAHFSREFKRSVGSTPWAYVMERRLMLAHQKLREGCSVSSVAYHCGFADQSHLSRAIRSRYGISPGELSATPSAQDSPQSEERRVGKECGSPCRSRWAP